MFNPFRKISTLTEDFAKIGLAQYGQKLEESKALDHKTPKSLTESNGKTGTTEKTAKFVEVTESKYEAAFGGDKTRVESFKAALRTFIQADSIEERKQIAQKVLESVQDLLQKAKEDKVIAEGWEAITSRLNRLGFMRICEGLAGKEVLEEGVKIQRVKRMSASKRAKARSSYRKKKSKIKRKRKMRMRKTSVKRKMKRLKALKRGRKAGTRRRFVLKTGMDRVSNMVESLSSINAQGGIFGAEVETTLKNCIAVMNSLEDRFEEVLEHIDNEFNADQKLALTEATLSDDTTEYDALIDIMAALPQVKMESVDILHKLKSGDMQPSEVEKLLVDIVKFLGGAVEGYADLAKEAKDLPMVGKDDPKDESLKLDDHNIGNEEVGKDQPKGQQIKPEANKVNDKVVGEKQPSDDKEFNVAGDKVSHEVVGQDQPKDEKQSPEKEAMAQKDYVGAK